MDENQDTRAQPLARTAALVRLDAGWQRIESFLCVAVLAAEIASLTLWVVLKGLSTDFAFENTAGLTCRRILTGAALAIAAHVATRRASLKVRRVAVSGGVVIGLVAARLWAHAGLHWSGNVFNWLQNSSSLMLVGGLRGLATRLTLWVALLGASLATSRARHIHVDVVVRYLPKALRGPSAIGGALVAALVCALGAVGFADYISIADFRATASRSCPEDPARMCDATASERLATVEQAIARDVFLLERQASLDVRAIPHVLAGDPYDGWLTAAEWNAWLDGADWTSHFDRSAVDALHMDMASPETTRAPQVSCPGTGDEARGLLARELTLVFPFGLAVLAIKFLIRALLALSRASAVGPDCEPAVSTPRAAKLGMSLAGLVVLALSIWGSVVAAGVVVLAILGTPLFAVLGGSAELLWLLHPDAAYRHLRFIAPTVLDERFADNPVVVTIPLFTFLGYVLAEARTPDRLVTASRTVLGWLPGGLAIVCVMASAIFTVLTGGSGVAIVAVGGLLYPALRKEGYSESFSLGLVTTGGSVGLLLPSLPLGAYAILAHLDLGEMFKAVLAPGLLVLVLLSAYAAHVASREGIAREAARLDTMASAIWDLKWEAGIFVLLLAGLATGLTTLDEAAAVVAFYVVVIEFFVYRDLSWKRDLLRIVGASMTLSGAIILILAMANALMNYVVDQQVPTKVLGVMTAIGIEHRWQFLIVMNVFLLLLGMLMEGFSAIFIAVPLILPFVAELGTRHPDEKMSPFQLGMIFVLNLEIAFCMPPLGLNLFLASSRFNRPVSGLYRAVLPFIGVLALGLVVVTYVPALTTVVTSKAVAAARLKAERERQPPRDAWMMECVQADSTNPQPCSRDDMMKYPGGQIPGDQPVTSDGNSAASPGADCDPDFGDCPKSATP
jgi:C4-dicarboxylate transporter DctM subunit